jgi:FKBP-type peptidyl-prolyl cis-trans isomerase SlyD
MNAPKKPESLEVLSQIEKPCVAALSWRLCDAQGELLDELLEPVDFLIGAEDLLPAIEDALLGQHAQAIVSLKLEPEQAFGDYQEEWVEWVHRKDCGADMAEGDALALLPGSKAAAPDGHVWIVTELYPDHAVLDANHPLAGLGLQIELKIHQIRAAKPHEIAARTVGTGFFRMRDFLTD